MFCPKCGSNQSDGKKFCTVCGTNLFIVSQALTGQLTQPQPMIHSLPPAAYKLEFERQKDTRKGITMAVLGGSYLVYQIISFLFSAPFNGWRSPFGFSTFIAFIVFAVGISRIISSRVIAETASATTSFANSATPFAVPQPSIQSQAALPQPVFSAASASGQSAPRTNELEPVPRLAPIVTEEETKHLTR
ncbi:MAG: zinc-ribbon domain-containing protein [Blastocatellia bacterium]